ncbi:Retrovirus-related Pol polyprotein from type-2 retrotransposable element R2DM [Anthophora retusa]
MVMDRLLKLIPTEIGVDIDGGHYNILAFADDVVFLASTPNGLQTMINLATDYLSQCGLRINTSKSFTVAIKNVPHLKKSVIDGKEAFRCQGHKLPSLRREDQWRYLGVPFSPEGLLKSVDEAQLKQTLEALTSAPLKPQQRMFALRVMVLPGLYHLLTLGNINLSKLKRVDTIVRKAVRKWLRLPKDVPNAYIHANAKDGGLSVPSMRWLMPLRRRERLERLALGSDNALSYVSQEIAKARRRLCERGVDFNTNKKLEQRWSMLLHSSCDGKALIESRKVPQQHQWTIEGNRFLTGRDYINLIRLRVNALPTRSRTTRGRRSDRTCRAGCNETETINHILQRCHRTHAARVERHNAIVSYCKRALEKSHERVDEEPHFVTPEGLRKPDLVATCGNAAVVIDAQVVSEQADLLKAHKNKIEYYKKLKDAIVTTYEVKNMKFTSATLSCRGVWCQQSSNDLVDLGIIKKTELKLISTRALIEGINAFWKFNKMTTTSGRARNREGIG